MSPPQPNDKKLVVCDTNVVVMMSIFAKTKMLDEGEYSFGELVIHESVVEELRDWRTSAAKKARFTEPVIDGFITTSFGLVHAFPALADPEKNRHFRAIGAVESQIGEEDRGADTSDEDKLYLTCAIKGEHFLATQESTLRSVAEKMITGRLLSFEDLVVDLFNSGRLSKDEVRAGLENLAYFKESLRSDQRKKVYDLIRE